MTNNILGVTLTDDQNAANEAFSAFLIDPDASVFVLSGYSGCGKEQPVSTTVQTPSGPRRFGDLAVGDFVFGQDGKPTKVLDIFLQGTKPVFHVTFRDGTSTRCGADHLWKVHTKKDKNAWRVLTTAQLIDAGLTNSAGAKFGIPLCDPVEYPAQPLPFDPYFIGALIGDGYLGGSTHAISCSDADVDIIERIKQTLPEGFELTYRAVGSCPQYNVVDRQQHNANRLKNHLKEIGLNVGSYEKHIPSMYLRASVQDRLRLLQGLMDTDGCSYANRISFSTMSTQLANDVKTLVQSLGGVAKIYTQDRTHENKGVEYRVNVRTSFNPFYCARKASGWKYSTKNPPSKYITSITQQGEEHQMCIMVDAPDHLYLTDDFIVTHNSTLIRIIMDEMPKTMKAIQLIQPQYREYDIALTATTNKAAENLSHITGMEVKTIHSYLSLRVTTDYRTGVTTLRSRKYEPLTRKLIFIDEASYIDPALLGFIFQMTKDCKIVFIGDPAQLTPVKMNTAPVFQAGFQGAALTQVVRQAEGNPIIDLSTKFRHAVNTGEFFNFVPDGHHIQRLGRDEFNDTAVNEFSRPDWKYEDSKLLAWTNKRVVEYNHYIREHTHGEPELAVGDYAMVNSYVQVGQQKLKTDQLVQITQIQNTHHRCGALGKSFTVDGRSSWFMPDSIAIRKEAIKQAKANDDYMLLAAIENTWIDLRAAYACTVNKSQGSTYGSVFIDLDDIARCNSGNQIARMLYVAVSRAKNHVFLTGDIG